MWFDDPYEEQEFGQERYEYDESDENEKLRELVKDINEVADPFLREFIERRMHELGIEVD